MSSIRSNLVVLAVVSAFASSCAPRLLGPPSPAQVAAPKAGVPQKREIWVVPDDCSGAVSGACYRVLHRGQISKDDAMGRCRTAGLQCDDYACSTRREETARAIELRCLYQSGAVYFEARTAKNQGDRIDDATPALATAFRRFIVDLGDPPTTSVAVQPAPSNNSAGYAPGGGGGGTVHVKGYRRKDGTYVKPHTRRAPRRK